MNFLNNDKGVSEVIGALLIFLILVVVLGSIQVYEVPKWNKELEMQNFDTVSADFIDMKSDLEDVSSQFVPKTSALHMGVKYPERFMLRNPGPAYGNLTTYPLNITVNYTLSDFNGTEIYRNLSFQSNGIEYELNGLSILPRLVYEHGIILRDFGENNFPEDRSQSLLNENADEFFIPIIDSSIALSSAETEPLNLNYLNWTILDTNNSGVVLNISSINISMETKYHESWNELISKFNKTNNLRVEGNHIIINMTGSSKKYLVYPNPNTDKDSINSGRLMFTSNLQVLRGAAGAPGLPGGGSGGNDGTQGPQGPQGPTGANGTQGQRGLQGGMYGVTSGPTEPEGAYTNERESMNWINLPTSKNATKFTLEDLNVARKSKNSALSFVITDINSSTFYVQIKLGGTEPPTSASVTINGDSKSTWTVDIIGGVAGVINLTSYYKNASIGYPNSLVVVEWESPSTQNIDSKILYFKYTIR